jgi:cobalamin biosynthesis Mg chelatase CobN
MLRLLVLTDFSTNQTNSPLSLTNASSDIAKVMQFSVDEVRDHVPLLPGTRMRIRVRLSSPLESAHDPSLLEASSTSSSASTLASSHAAALSVGNHTNGSLVSSPPVAALPRLRSPASTSSSSSKSSSSSSASSSTPSTRTPSNRLVGRHGTGTTYTSPPPRRDGSRATSRWYVGVLVHVFQVVGHFVYTYSSLSPACVCSSLSCHLSGDEFRCDAHHPTGAANG